MQYDYGYIRGTTGADGEEIDCYIGANRAADRIYVVKQHDIGKVSKWPSDDCPVCAQHAHECACLDFYDEDKVFIGFDNKAAVIAAYKTHYDNDRFLGPIEEWPVADYRSFVQQQQSEKRIA